MSSTATDPAAYCLEQVRRFDHDRYLALLFAPASHRRALVGLHAFNVEVARTRETVREMMLGEIRLQWWRDALAEAREGRPRQHPVVLELAPALAAGRLNPDALEALLTARELDLRATGPADLAELEAYVAGTSSTLVQMSLDLMGEDAPAARAAAYHVGLAWGLTGLLRAVPFHASQRRRYLPADMLGAAGISDNDLAEGRAGPSLSDVARSLAERATSHLAAARKLRPQIAGPARRALLPATLADLYLKRLARVGFDVFAPALQHKIGSRALRLALAAWRRGY